MTVAKGPPSLYLGTDDPSPYYGPRKISGLLLVGAAIAVGQTGTDTFVFALLILGSLIMLEDRGVLMQSDTIKLIFTYVLALIVVVGGGAILFVTRLDPADAQSDEYGLLIAGFIGSALTWAFTKEAATQATRAAQSTQRETQVGGHDATT